MSQHDWQMIGHIGDGNEYVVWTCRKCGCRATTEVCGWVRSDRPKDSKYPPCTDPEPETVWDRLMDSE